ncbi:hypothetical protein PGT21_019734 [Puccinia graminis f. sp. tritici]|uniref:Zn(2)-C6 fungal-type domain-containing protein n=1 Tax=Puccinia graminis f. sp. tritici TaxID=56615 RepID=A0A5B0NUX7_PUCGR|nr:hypothetical protein PGT21_019734 [Puccinia graminis f. sp. tritici]KAA1115695.1 hypothetical protein PGTUg99_026352 [Puccinia graminis f. sp. tritici]
MHGVTIHACSGLFPSRWRRSDRGEGPAVPDLPKTSKTGPWRSTNHCQIQKPSQNGAGIPRSCDKCRISKVKCVLENDRCNNCVRLGVTCTFANPGSLKERPPTHK